MKKKAVAILISIALMIPVLSGCGENSANVNDNSAETVETVKDEESAAETTEPEVVEEAESAEPEPEEPEAEPHEHEWIPATLENPMTCSICGETEGEPVTCKEMDPDKITGEVEWDKAATFPESIVCTKKTDDNVIQYAFYDYDGNLLSEGSKPIDAKYWSWGYSTPEPLALDGKIGLQIALLDLDDNIDITLFDRKGNLLKEDSFSYYIDEGYVSLMLTDDPRYLAEVTSSNRKVLKYLDTETLELIDPSEGDHAIWWDTDFDESKYEFCGKLTGKAQEDIGGYFVKTIDGTQLGFTDKDFNEIKMYANATNFNMYGYAMVSEDGKNFDIVDTDFNIVAKDFIQADTVWLRNSTTGPGVVFSVSSDDWNKWFIVK